MRSHRIYKATDGLRVDDLLHSGLNHISTAEHLLQQSASFWDGAGYLAHMGFELLLKAWLLHKIGSFEGVHKLRDLWKKIEKADPAVSLSGSARKTLALLDEYEKLRYPNRKDPIEIGTDDWPQVKALEKELWAQMQDEFESLVSELDPLQKGGRVLMKRPE